MDVTANFCDVVCTWERNIETDTSQREHGQGNEITDVTYYFIDDNSHEACDSRLDDCNCDGHKNQHFRRHGKEKALPCFVTIQCKPKHNVFVKEVLAGSNAKRIELYGKGDEYVATLQGTSITEGADTDRPMFETQVLLQEPALSCKLKFLSLQPKDTLVVQSFKIWLSQQPQVSSVKALPAGCHFDVQKLRMRLQSDGIPENAQRLLDGIEQYQKNQASTTHNFHTELTQSMGKNDLTGPMAAMFTMLGSSDVDNSALRNMCTAAVRRQRNDNEKKTNVDSENSLDLMKITGKKVETGEDKSESELYEKLETSLQQNMLKMEERIMERMDRMLKELENRLVEKFSAIVSSDNPRTGVESIIQGHHSNSC